MIDVSLWMQKDSITAHLVNLPNPMMMKGPIREVIPAPPQTVVIRIPDGLRVKRVQLLVSGRSPDVKQQAGFLRIEIQSIELHEVVAVDVA